MIFDFNLSRILTGKNKIAAMTKRMNMDIWVVSISNQIFIRGSNTETKFSKK